MISLNGAVVGVRPRVDVDLRPCLAMGRAKLNFPVPTCARLDARASVNTMREIIKGVLEAELQGCTYNVRSLGFYLRLSNTFVLIIFATTRVLTYTRTLVMQ